MQFLVGGVGIHHNGRPDCIFERCSFDGDSAISGILGRVMITGGKSTGVLTVDGEANYLSITDISVNVLQVWFYKIEPTSVRNGSHDFAIRPLDVAGHLDISRIKSTEGAVLHVQPHKFAANAHMKITNCSIAINCRGITLPERFEFFIERNESEYIDLRNIVCATSSRTTIRKQHLRGLLVSGTRLDTFYLSDVLFAQSGGHAYLPEDAGATHLPALLQEPDQFSGSPIYKICNGSSDQGAVLSSYRQLIAKFDNERDFLKSESLHFREMDLARLLYRHEQVQKFGRVGTIVAAISPHALYKVLAKYGTSYSRALFCVILLLVVVFPMAFLAIGLKGKDDGAQKNNLAYSISNTVCINPPHCFEVKREFIRDWGIAITYTLQIATLQKDESLEPVGWIGKFIKALALPIILGQLALFFVALKRHFRRQIS